MSLIALKTLKFLWVLSSFISRITSSIIYLSFIISQEVTSVKVLKKSGVWYIAKWIELRRQISCRIGRAILDTRNSLKLSSLFITMIETNSDVKLIKLQAIQIEKRRNEAWTT